MCSKVGLEHKDTCLDWPDEVNKRSCIKITLCCLSQHQHMLDFG